MSPGLIKEVLCLHASWLVSDKTGKRANLSYAHLSGADLSYANLSDANLRGANLSGAHLSGADLSGADLSYADLSDANLSGAHLRGANLSGANLSGADLSGAHLRGANLSGADGLLNPIEWLSSLERTEDGIVAYKSFGQNYDPPKTWEIEVGSVITEVVNPDRCSLCACGINVAKRDWCDMPQLNVWRVLIRWEWLPSVVVPYNTDGKFRCGRCELLEKIS